MSPSLLPLLALLAAAAGGALTGRAGQAVTATATATVESVVSDEGFRVGSSAQDRVVVFLTPEARRRRASRASR